MLLKVTIKKFYCQDTKRMQQLMEEIYTKRERIDWHMKKNIKNSNVFGSSKNVYYAQVSYLVDYLKNTGKNTRMREDEMLDACRSYIDDLKRNGKNSHSIHTAISACAKGLGVEMKEIGQVRRQTSTKGRSSVGYRNAGNERICNFASMVGIRRAEYSELTGKDLIEKNGDTFVVVRKGKGGKYQEQLIAAENVDDVKKYFAGRGENEKIFSQSEIKGLHNANVHALRRENAQKMYRYYAAMPPDERSKMIEKLRQRFNENQKKYGRLNEEELSRPYYARNKKIIDDLKKNGFGRKLDRFALMCVAVFHLAHYRVNVVVQNYMR